jgi:hypothetical protein
MPKIAAGKKKGPFEAFERPKSREETPKEGCGLDRSHDPSRTAKDDIAAHKNQ